MSDGLFITPDFSQVQDQVGEGIYNARIVDAKTDKWTGKDGKPDTHFINWRMETFNEADDKNNGRSIFHRTPIHGPGAFRLQEFYKAAMGEECANGFDASMLFGREVQVAIGRQTKNPDYTEVKSVKSLN